MARITMSFYRDVVNEHHKEEITISRLVEKLNEEASRTQPTNENDNTIFKREECSLNYCTAPSYCRNNNECILNLLNK